MYKWDTHIATDWRRAIPPARPSLSELVVFDQYLRRFPRGSSVLILGSTQEFRDICYCQSLDTTAVDYNAKTFHILGKGLRHPSVAHLVVQDWRNMEFENRFDVVIGDLAINMMSISEQAIVMKNISNALKKDGLLIHRVWIRQPGRYTRPTTTFGDILAEHKAERPNADYFFSLALPFIHYFFDEERKCIDFQIMLQGLREAYRDNLIPKECLRAFERPWHRYFMPNWLQTADEVEQMMSHDLAIVSVGFGSDFYSDFCPIYVMKAKE